MRWWATAFPHVALKYPTDVYTSPIQVVIQMSEERWQLRTPRSETPEAGDMKKELVRGQYL